MTNREIFCKAHATAKEIRSYFMRYRDAFAFALRGIYAGLRVEKAEAAAKAVEKTVEEKLEDLGIDAWERGGMKRYYVNADKVESVFGLEISRYNTGNICGASLNGESISNTRAGKLLARKIYFDAASRQWTQQRPGCRPEPLCDELMGAIRI